jgi:hypothetical protein
VLSTKVPAKLKVEGQAIPGNATWPGIVIVRARLVFACRKHDGVDVVENPWENFTIEAKKSSLLGIDL